MKTNKNESGQIIVEYVLLLLVAVSLALLINRSLLSRDPESPGAIMSKWNQIWEAIGNDSP